MKPEKGERDPDWGGAREGAGRPRKPAYKRRSRTTWVRWSPEEYRAIVAAAKAAEMDLADWTREVLMRAAKK